MAEGTQDALFYVEEPECPPAPPKLDPSLSYGRKLTMRNKEQLDKGIHPVTGRPLKGDGETCSTCSHFVRRRLGGTYLKCDLNMTGGPATDIRASWPACTAWDRQT